MDLSKILAISGKPDLYKHVAQSRNGVVIENITDGKRLNAFASDKISALQDIAIFTTGEDLPLADVFRKIFQKENGGQSIDHKSSNEDIKKYFEEVLPEFDKERVYVSDMKRLFKWYNTLQKQNLVDMEIPEKEETEKAENTEVIATEPIAQEPVKPAKKTPAKKTTPKKEKGE
jgi:hypothetical protein